MNEIIGVKTPYIGTSLMMGVECDKIELTCINCKKIFSDKPIKYKSDDALILELNSIELEACTCKQCSCGRFDVKMYCYLNAEVR